MFSAPFRPLGIRYYHETEFFALILFLAIHCVRKAHWLLVSSWYHVNKGCKWPYKNSKKMGYKWR